MSLRTLDPSSRRRRQRGFTLVELLVALVVVAAAVGGALSLFVTAGGHSADPMIRSHALAIAQAYLDEAILKDFDDPDGGETGSCEAGESRGDFDDVWDYACINDVGARDQYGNAIAGLAGYTVTMTVVDSTAAFGAGLASALIRVNVTHAVGVDLQLQANRADI